MSFTSRVVGVRHLEVAHGALRPADEEIVFV